MSTLTPPLLYARLLTSSHANRGFPLWHPEPDERYPEYREDGLQFGDVEFVDDNGFFTVMFNICKPANHRLHSSMGVPQGFRQILIPADGIRRVRYEDDEHCLMTSGSLVDNQAIIELTAPSGGRVLGLDLASSHKEGAFLFLQEGSRSEDVHNTKDLFDEANRSGKAWYEFLVSKYPQTDRVPFTNDCLFLITGFQKAKRFALGVLQNYTSNSEAFVRIPIGGGIAGNIHSTSNWQVSPTSPDNAPENQTVFIRGFNISIRQRLFSLLRREGDSIHVDRQLPTPVVSIDELRTINSKSQPLRTVIPRTAGSAPRATQARSRGGENRSPHQKFSGLERVFHPSNLISTHILDNMPTCEVAVIPDEVWIEISEQVPHARWDQPEDQVKLLKKFDENYTVVDINGMSIQ
ncbi:hypothetical protein V8B97DRAFT_1918846 [Scleroderma yunnanense]